MEAFLSWLKGMGFERHAESVREFLDEYMPAQESVALFFTIVIWLIAIATVALIVHEFYRAGMLKLPGFQRRQAAIEKVERKPVMQLEQIRRLPLREQISALLQYSIEHLVNSNLLPSSRSLTNRELISYLEKSDVQKAGLLREQIDITEPVIYGDEGISEQLIETCLLKTRGLSGA